MGWIDINNYRGDGFIKGRNKSVDDVLISGKPLKINKIRRDFRRVFWCCEKCFRI
jgi:hypothetical protein